MIGADSIRTTDGSPPGGDASSPKKRRRWGCRIALAVVLLLIAGEVAARIFADYNSRFNIFVGGLTEWDPQRRTRLKKDYRQGTISVNSRGFLGPEFEPVKAPGTYRIVTLGDSCSFLPTGANYPRQLETILNERELGPRVEIINACCPGYTSIQARSWYENEVDDYAHDMLIIFLGWNDLGQFGPEGLGFKLHEAGYLKEPNIAQKLMINCYLLRSTYVLQGHWQRRQPVSLDPLTPDEDTLYQAYYPSHYEENLKQVIALARKRGRSVRLLNLGCLVNSDPTTDEMRRMHFPRGMGKKLAKYLALIARYDAALNTIAADTDTPIIDIASLFDTVAARKVFTDSVHFNERGATMIAHRVAEAMAPVIAANTAPDGS